MEETVGIEAGNEELPAPEMEAVASEVKQSDKDLLSLNEAISRVPESLRKEMTERLRAEFREVREWQPSKGR